MAAVVRDLFATPFCSMNNMAVCLHLTAEQGIYGVSLSQERLFSALDARM